MKTSVHQRAIELGFDACRVTTAAPPAGAGHLREWLAAQRHGTMAYLPRTAHRRVDPQQVLPGAKSIITLAASYADDSATGHLPSAIGDLPSAIGHGPLALRLPATGVIARYARFADYHRVLAAPLQALTDHIHQLGGNGTRSRWYVDSGPVFERDLAQRAGLGFVGKHTNLISRRLGNWLLLAEILTTVELEPDAPEKNRCGSCTRCLVACPTRAFTAPFQLDARRCISYLTIELTGSIPPDLRPALGTRIFGCDDCLAVCPWNRFAREGKLMKAQARSDLVAPELLELLLLDEAGFKRRFAATPIVRAKRRGLLRNVCVALGNLGDPGALPALERAAGDPEPLITEHARWAIQRIRGSR